jgi:hypothetical protein
VNLITYLCFYAWTPCLKLKHHSHHITVSELKSHFLLDLSRTTNIPKHSKIIQHIYIYTYIYTYTYTIIIHDPSTSHPICSWVNSHFQPTALSSGQWLWQLTEGGTCHWKRCRCRWDLDPGILSIFPMGPMEFKGDDGKDLYVSEIVFLLDRVFFHSCCALPPHSYLSYFPFISFYICWFLLCFFLATVVSFLRGASYDRKLWWEVLGFAKELRNVLDWVLMQQFHNISQVSECFMGYSLSRVFGCCFPYKAQ